MTMRSINGFAVFICLLLLAAAVQLTSCATEQEKAGEKGEELAAESTELGGAELWARRCDKCHNFRPAETLSDAQWNVVVRHMRVRAKLNGEEERKILAFLKSGN